MRSNDEAAKRILAGAGQLTARARAERAGTLTFGQTGVLRHLTRSGPLTPWYHLRATSPRVVVAGKA